MIKTCDMASGKDFCCETIAKHNEDGTVEIIESLIFDVIEYETAILMGVSIGETRCSNTGSMVNSLACKACKSFAGHEVAGKSIRCIHRANELKEGK
jgi:hypothetical protein